MLVSPSPEKLPPPRPAAKGGETKDKKDDANTKDDTGDDELPEVNMVLFYLSLSREQQIQCTLLLQLTC